MADVGRCRFVAIPRFSDDRGSLSFVQPGPSLPFDIQRVYYLYDIPPDRERGAHGHRKLQQLIVAVAGAVDVECDDGREKRTFRLDSPDKGLYVCPMIWRRLSGFSAGTVCLVLASEPYDESDYFRSYDDFLSVVLRT
jgi:hypothetical protein